MASLHQLESLMLYNYSNHPYAHTTVVETSIVKVHTLSGFVQSRFNLIWN